MQNLDTQYIRSVAKQNGYSISVYSAILMVVLAILYFEAPENLQLPLMFLMGCSVVGVVMGVFKIQEPDVSFMLNNQGILYHHKRGFLLIEWENVQRIDIPKVHQGLESVDLAFVGIKLVDPEKILGAISLRLISHLLIEQRAILHRYLKEDCPTGTCISEITLNTDAYKSDSGIIYTGLRGMFAHRMAWLRKLSGYDLLIPESAFDRPAEEFAQLLKHFKQEAETV
ncbi:DUF2982 domain-containing protein [Catenovulum sediminis]|uniref:DUF2982 domain-containing protein n=1 Tax=Catenovulum sediminis TaxID=1740262 RepID=UPI00117D509E|nr:DUF2982 domain-containing protein [Catenovulum sediminis]